MKKCKIVFLDEVNAKVTGLDPVTLNACMDALKFLVPYRFHMPAYKLGRWDGSVRFFEKSGKTYINLLPDVLPIIAKNGYGFDFEDLRKTGDIELPKIDKDVFAHISWPVGHFMEGQPIQLRDDQVAAANFFADNRYGLQVLATGFGKCVGADTLLEIDGFGETTIETFYDHCTKSGEKVDADTYRTDKDYTITAPDGEIEILGVTRKAVEETYTFTFNNGYVCTVSPEHKFFVDGLPVEARNIFIYKEVDHIDGKMGIASLSIETKPVTLYDISVGYPNAYYDANGVLHHNTLLTAAICKVAEGVGRTVTIVPSKSLVEQTADDFRLVEMDVGVYYGDEKDPTHMHTITTWQSLNEIFENRRMEVIEDMFVDVKQVLVDECFDGEMEVLTPDGVVAIKDLEEGDAVLNYSETTNQFKEDYVVRIHKNLTHSDSEDMLELVFDTLDRPIQVTANHKFLTENGWVRADKLTSDHVVVSAGKTGAMRLLSETVIEKPEEVYNLHIKNDHNYVVNGAVVSNCHQAKSKSLDTILGTYLNHIPLRRGFTGTLPKEKFDEKTIIANIGPVVNRVTAKELQDRGILARCHVHCVVTEDKKVFSSFEQEVAALNKDPDRLDFIAEFSKLAQDTGNTLILVNNIKTGETLNDLIPNSVFVYGKTKVKERKSTYQSVQTSDNKVIIATYQVAAVGINIPRIFNLIMIEAGKSFIRVIQTIGRGIRVAKDKDFVNIWDISSECKFSKKHLAARVEYYDEAEYPHDKFSGSYEEILEMMRNYDGES